MAWVCRSCDEVVQVWGAGSSGLPGLDEKGVGIEIVGSGVG